MTMIFILALIVCAVGAALIEHEKRFIRGVVAPFLLTLCGVLMTIAIMTQIVIVKKSKYNVETEVRTESVNNRIVSQDTVYIITRK